MRGQLPVQPEREVLKQCLELLRLLGVPAWRTNSGAVTAEYGGKKRLVRFNGAEGCSDIIGLLPPSGRLLAIETKRVGGKATAKQQGFLEAVQAAGGLALVVHSAAQLQDALKQENA